MATTTKTKESAKVEPPINGEKILRSGRIIPAAPTIIYAAKAPVKKTQDNSPTNKKRKVSGDDEEESCDKETRKSTKKTETQSNNNLNICLYYLLTQCL